MSTLLDLYQDVWNPQLIVLTIMERNGWLIDQGIFHSAVKDLEEKYSGLEQELNTYAGQELNWDSGPQRVEYLYNNLNLPVPPICGSLKAVKRTPRGKTPTDAVALRWLHENNAQHKDFLGNLRQARKLSTALPRFRNFPKHVHPKTGRLHYSIKASTDTGRLSISNPPLQQVPKEGIMRKAFIAAPGHSLIVADYSALEMRILAHFLIEKFGDHTLANDLLKEDFHQATADRLGISREFAKAVNYSVNYGKTASGLAVQLDLTRPQAQEILDRYFEVYPGVQRWQTYCESFANRTGYVVTLLGRRRYLPWIQSSVPGKYGSAFRKAINTPIQGSAADLVLMAMLRTNSQMHPDLLRLGYFQRELFILRCKQLAQIHDELVFEVPTENAADALDIVRREMEQPFEKALHVAFPVDAKVCPSWAEGK